MKAARLFIQSWEIRLMQRSAAQFVKWTIAAASFATLLVAQFAHAPHLHRTTSAGEATSSCQVASCNAPQVSACGHVHAGHLHLGGTCHDDEAAESRSSDETHGSLLSLDGCCDGDFCIVCEVITQAAQPVSIASPPLRVEQVTISEDVAASLTSRQRLDALHLRGPPATC